MRLKDFAIVIRTKKTTWNIRGTNSLSDFLRQARRVTSVQLDVHLTTHASFAAYSPRIQRTISGANKCRYCGIIAEEKAIDTWISLVTCVTRLSPQGGLRSSIEHDKA